MFLDSDLPPMVAMEIVQGARGPAAIQTIKVCSMFVAASTSSGYTYMYMKRNRTHVCNYQKEENLSMNNDRGDLQDKTRHTCTSKHHPTCTTYMYVTTSSIFKETLGMTEWKRSEVRKTITSLRIIKLKEGVVLPNLRYQNIRRLILKKVVRLKKHVHVTTCKCTLVTPT